MSFLKFAFQELASPPKSIVTWSLFLKESYQRGRKKIMDYTTHARTGPSNQILHGLHVYLFIYFSDGCCVIISFLCPLWCYAVMVSNVFLPFFSSSDEEKVGPWPRGPIFPFRKKALQRPRVSEVKQPTFHPQGLTICSTDHLPISLMLQCSPFPTLESKGIQ